jgi:hypothetical protein
MKFRSILLALSLLALTTFGLGTQQPDQPPQQENPQGAKQDMKNAGKATKDAAQDAGRATKKTAKKTAHETKKGANQAAKKTKQGSEKVEDKTQPNPPSNPPQQ